MKKQIHQLFIVFFFIVCQQSYAQIVNVTTFAGSGSQGATNGTGTSASFKSPYSLAVDASENVYVADTDNHLIRKITPAGVVSTFAGSGSAGSVNGTGTASSFNYPEGIAVDALGNVYVGDTYNQVIRKITPAGDVTTLAGSGSVGSVNGTGAAASFNYPKGVAVDASGNVYVADSGNNLIRKITAAGVVSTLAGSGSQGSTDANGMAASFRGPSALVSNDLGNLYVADTYNNSIRKITSAGDVTTLAGSGSPGATNGTGIGAKFYYPAGVTLDGSGNIYVADVFNDVIRKITAAGVVSTFAGSGNTGSTNGSGTTAKFNLPNGVAIGASGNLYVADQSNHLIRKITNAIATGVSDLTSVTELTLFPVPASDQLTLTLTLKLESDLRLELINLAGIKVASLEEASYSAGNHALNLFVGYLPSGLYLANIYSNKQMTSQKVFIGR